jgi:hypothetical protein
MDHTDFGEWRVTHDDLRIYHALQPCTLELADYSDAEKLLATLAAVSAEDWASAKTIEDLIQALDFALELCSVHKSGSSEKVDSEGLRKALKAR